MNNNIDNPRYWTAEQWYYYYAQWLIINKEESIIKWYTHRDAIYNLIEPPVSSFILNNKENSYEK